MVNPFRGESGVWMAAVIGETGGYEQLDGPRGHLRSATPREVVVGAHWLKADPAFGAQAHLLAMHSGNMLG